MSVLGAQRTGRGGGLEPAGVRWFLSTWSPGIPVQVLPGMKLVDGEVVILRRAGKSNREVERHAEPMKRYNNKKRWLGGGGWNVFCFYKYVCEWCPPELCCEQLALSLQREAALINGGSWNLQKRGSDPGVPKQQVGPAL